VPPAGAGKSQLRFGDASGADAKLARRHDRDRVAFVIDRGDAEVVVALRALLKELAEPLLCRFERVRTV
jgi:hypothetical protein